MSPRCAPDLDQRRAQLVRAARSVAEADGWSAVTIRRLASELGVTQPVVYSAFDNRQAILDAVALDGFSLLAVRLHAAKPIPAERMTAYLEFAVDWPRLYEAMFSLPTGLMFAHRNTPQPMRDAFAGIKAGFSELNPAAAETQAEVAWATWHGLATLTAHRRLRPEAERERLQQVGRLLTTISRSPQ